MLDDVRSSSPVGLVVAGAGVAGAVAALCAARAGVPTVLLDAGAARRRPELGETLAPEAVGELTRLGLAAAVDDAGLPCRASRSVWGDGRLRTREHLVDGRRRPARLPPPSRGPARRGGRGSRRRRRARTGPGGARRPGRRRAAGGRPDGAGAPGDRRDRSGGGGRRAAVGAEYPPAQPVVADGSTAVSDAGPVGVAAAVVPSATEHVPQLGLFQSETWDPDYDGVPVFGNGALH